MSTFETNDRWTKHLFRTLIGGKPQLSAADRLEWERIARAETMRRVRRLLGIEAVESRAVVAQWVSLLLATNHGLDADLVEFANCVREAAESGQDKIQSTAIAMQSSLHEWSESKSSKMVEKLAREDLPRACAWLLTKAEAGEVEDRPSPEPTGGERSQLGRGHLVFGYGSLLDPLSLGTTIHREVQSNELVPAALIGYRLVWGAAAPNLALVAAESFEPAADIDFAALAISPDLSSRVQGALVAVDDVELSRIDEREARYDRVDVASSIQLDEGMLDGRPVYAYIPKPGSHPAEDRIRVRTGYFTLINSALGSLATPEPPPLADYLDPDQIVRHYEWTNPTSGMTWAATLDSYLRRDRVFRKRLGNDTAPSLARPLVVSALVFDRLRAASEAAVKYSAEIMSDVVSGGRAFEYGISEHEASIAKEFASASLPEIARVDLVASRGHVSVLEVNSDSPAGIHHVSKLADHIRTWRGTIGERDIDFLNAHDAMKRAAQAIGAPIPGSEEAPSVAIVEKDPEEWASYFEMQAFREVFVKEGAPYATICDPRELVLDSQNRLSVGGREVQVVYKRALWNDLGEHATKVLLAAASAGEVSVRNSLAARFAGNKRVLTDLWQLSCSSPNHPLAGFVPETHVATADIRDQIVSHPESWVLKSLRGFASEGFIAATANMTRTKWKRAVESELNGTHIAQRRVPHATFVVDEPGGLAVTQRAIFGAYVVAGECVAIEAKIGPKLPISMNQGARRAIVGTIRP